MKRAVRETALRLLTQHRSSVDSVRRSLRVQLRDVLTEGGAKDLDALLLAADKLFLSEQREVALADEEDEPRTPDQEAADARAAAVKAPT